MAKKRTAKYWKNRAVYLKKRLINRSVEEYEWMAEQYEKAAKNIQREIEYWYARFAENNEISLADAKKLLTSRELKELKWEVEEYIEKGRTLNYSDQWAKELENASARAHINRYEALQIQMQQQAEALYGGQQDATDEALREIYQDGYYRTAYDVQKGFEVGWNLAALDERRIEKALARPWGVDGKNFSDRIWENKNKLIGTLNKTLTQSIIRGEAPDKAIKEISRVMEVDRKKAGRLVMTESAFIASESQKDCYKELGVEYFEVLATLDSHTCSDCGVREGQKIPMSEYESGVTAPPFHPYCRCCTVPAFEDEFDVGERAARCVDGKTYYVPGNMSYEEWKAQQDALYGAGTVDLQRKMNYNESVDRKQWERYKEFFGSDFPQSFNVFQQMKYTDAERWEHYKAIARTKNHLQQKLSYVWNGEKSFVPQYAKFSKVSTMAGAGTEKPIRDVARLVAVYHNPADTWKKRSGRVDSDKYIFDLHWYEADDGLQREVKLKYRSERKK